MLRSPQLPGGTSTLASHGLMSSKARHALQILLVPPHFFLQVDGVRAIAIVFVLHDFDSIAFEQLLDLIFLDPPSFIKNRSAKEAGLRGYKELNLRSLRLLPPGGILVSSSCSYHLDRETFWGLVQEAAADQHMDVQLLDIWGQGPDHPCMSNFSESDYLKTLVLQRLS